MVALALLCRDGTDGSAAAGLRRGGGVPDGMVSLCGRTGCRYMRNPAYGSAVAGTAERARAETLSGTSEACLSALPSETKKPLKTAAFSLLVPRTRLELTRRKPALPPQSSVSTNFTTWALLSRINFRECKYRHYFAIRKIFAEKTTKFAWGPPGAFCGGPGMLYLSVISLSR